MKKNKKYDWFELDEWVWFVRNDLVEQKQIRGIWRYSEDNQQVYYLFSERPYLWQQDAYKIPTNKCFATKKELLESL